MTIQFLNALDVCPYKEEVEKPLHEWTVVAIVISTMITKVLMKASPTTGGGGRSNRVSIWADEVCIGGYAKSLRLGPLTVSLGLDREQYFALFVRRNDAVPGRQQMMELAQ